MIARRRLLACALVPALLFIGVGVWILKPLPASMLERPAAVGVVLEDRHGVVLRTTRAADGLRERWIPYAKIDANVINAFVAVEDRRFWDHAGVDVIAIARATYDNTLHHRVMSGASTITMQLARIMRPARRSVTGKLVQALWALRLERHLGKQQILEQYLNRIELGQATVGIGAASNLYFSRDASNLSIAQAALLAGIAHSPSRENPLSSVKHARARRALALRRMRDRHYASREEVRGALSEPIVEAASSTPFLAPHFTSRVLAWMADDSASAPRAPVRTSLDAELQHAVETEVRYTVSTLRDRGVEQAAAVVLDNNTGEILAWVGSPDFWADGDGQTDLIVSKRQPGSTLKPFLYALAFDRGYSAATVLADIPKAYATATGSYSPRNYDRRFRGPVRAREALASSYNVPAVELASRVGTGSLLGTLHLAGFESLDRGAEYYGLGLALGNGDVTLIELANAYRALARGGEFQPVTWRHASSSFARIPANTSARRFASPTASAIVLDILSDPLARIPGFGTNTPFDFPFRVAVKTGTSRHFTDNWAVATTAGFTVAVWAGNFSGHPMQGVSGVTGAGPLLHRVVMESAKHVQPGELPPPVQAGAVAASVCRLSGLRSNGHCRELTEWFVPGTVPTVVDDWERGAIASLPPEFDQWSQQQGIAVSTVARTGSTHSAPGPSLRITSPRDHDQYAIPSDIDPRYATLSLRVSGSNGTAVKWFVDGAAYEGVRWQVTQGSHVFRVRAPDGQVAEARVEVR